MTTLPTTRTPAAARHFAEAAMAPAAARVMATSWAAAALALLATVCAALSIPTPAEAEAEAKDKEWAADRVDAQTKAATSDDAPTASTQPEARTLVFTALLDGKPIGEHRYSVGTDDGGRQRLQSTAAFDVKFLGFTAYRYRHTDTEVWTGAGCVATLDATTDDGGTKAAVTARADGTGLAVDTPAGRRIDTGCVVSFPSLYWHAGITAHAGTVDAPRPAHLLNPQDGRDEPVQITAAADAAIEVHGTPVQARHLQITRPDGPIDLWYRPDGAWIGLDALVKGKRLRYRLK